MSIVVERGDQNRELLERGQHVMPGGVNSPVRSFRSVGGTPRFVRSASGSYVTDVNGQRLLDFVGSWGVSLLGHAPELVVQAAQEAVGKGMSYGTPTPEEVEFAELLTDWVPGLDMIRLVNSGTEATMSALRLARAATGRSGLIKFRGGYHGHADSFLVAAGSGAATLGVPSSPGVPPEVAKDTAVVEFNDLEGVRETLRRRPKEIAAIIVEPVSGNMGCIPPEPGFLEGLRLACDEHGAILIFDEVMTGFRVGPKGAIGLYGVIPDLVTMGKVVGGGFPLAVYGGKRSLMSQVAPAGDVYQAGTLSGNPVAVAAGLASLRTLTGETSPYDHLDQLGHLLDKGMRRIIEGSPLPLCWNRVGAMGSLFFSGGPIVNWAGAGVGADRFAPFFHAMLERGIHLPPSSYEAWFWSLTHTEDHIHQTLVAIEESLEVVARES